VQQVARDSAGGEIAALHGVRHVAGGFRVRREDTRASLLVRDAVGHCNAVSRVHRNTQRKP
jgi:hypothetical protein